MRTREEGNVTDSDGFYGPEHADQDAARAIRDDHRSGFHAMPHGGCPLCPEIDHVHECRRCGESIPCNGDGETCWAGDNDRCPNESAELAREELEIIAKPAATDPSGSSVPVAERTFSLEELEDWARENPDASAGVLEELARRRKHGGAPPARYGR